jgi:hypothetical protein
MDITTGSAGGERKAQASLSLSAGHAIHLATDAEMPIACHTFPRRHMPIPCPTLVPLVATAAM